MEKITKILTIIRNVVSEILKLILFVLIVIYGFGFYEGPIPNEFNTLLIILVGFISIIELEKINEKLDKLKNKDGDSI